VTGTTARTKETKMTTNVTVTVVGGGCCNVCGVNPGDVRLDYNIQSVQGATRVMTCRSCRRELVAALLDVTTHDEWPTKPTKGGVVGADLKPATDEQAIVGAAMTEISLVMNQVQDWRPRGDDMVRHLQRAQSKLNGLLARLGQAKGPADTWLGTSDETAAALVREAYAIVCPLCVESDDMLRLHGLLRDALRLLAKAATLPPLSSIQKTPQADDAVYEATELVDDALDLARTDIEEHAASVVGMLERAAGLLPRRTVADAQAVLDRQDANIKRLAGKVGEIAKGLQAAVDDSRIPDAKLEQLKKLEALRVTTEVKKGTLSSPVECDRCQQPTTNVVTSAEGVVCVCDACADPEAPTQAEQEAKASLHDAQKRVSYVGAWLENDFVGMVVAAFQDLAAAQHEAAVCPDAEEGEQVLAAAVSRLPQLVTALGGKVAPLFAKVLGESMWLCQFDPQTYKIVGRTDSCPICDQTWTDEEGIYHPPAPWDGVELPENPNPEAGYGPDRDGYDPAPC